jgi:hypothetical protein
MVIYSKIFSNCICFVGLIGVRSPLLPETQLIFFI